MKRQAYISTLTLQEQNDLVVKNIKLPCAIAVKMFKHFIRISMVIRLEDLIAEGYWGLVLAARKYNPDKGPFNFYASKTITNSILAHIYSFNHMVVKGSVIAAKTKKILKRIKEERLDTAEDIAETLQELKIDSMTLASILTTLGLTEHTSMVGTEVIDEPGVEAIIHARTSIPNTPMEHGNKLDKTMFINRIIKLMNIHLSTQDIEIVYRRLGIDPYQEAQSLSDIGSILGISQERVRYRFLRAISKLRRVIPDSYWSIMYENFV